MFREYSEQGRSYISTTPDTVVPESRDETAENTRIPRIDMIDSLCSIIALCDT